MIKFCTLVAVIAAAIFLWNGSSYAETVQGKIVEINPTEKSLTLNRFDAASGQPEQLEMSIDAETQFKGINSLDALKVGDDVMVEADQNFVTRQWTVNLIQKGSGTLAGTQGQAQQKSEMGSQHGAGASQTAAGTGAQGSGDAGTKARTPGGGY